MLVKGTKNKSMRVRSSAVLLETLELRTMMANTIGMDITPAPQYFHEAPPAIVEYVDPATQNAGDTNGSLPVDPTTNQANNSRSLGVYDATWGGARFGRDVYWTGLCAWGTDKPDEVDMNRKKVEAVAKISRDGGKAVWTGIDIAAGSMTILDMEHHSLEGRSPTYVADRVRWFKAAAPNVPVGVSGYTMWKGMNLDNFARWNASDKAMFKEQVQARRGAMDAGDFIVFGVYMLGPNCVDRDLAAYKNMMDGYRELFPNKAIVPFIWGAYHTSFNPENSVFSDEVTDRLVQTLCSSSDGVVVWGPRQDNEKLIAALQRPGNTVLPTDRKATFASTATNLNPPTNGSLPGDTLPGDGIDSDPVIP